MIAAIIKLASKTILISGLMAGSAFASYSVDSKSIIGRVVNVLTGDTVQLLLPAGELVQVKLAGIKAPSRDEEVGKQSHTWLTSQLKDQLVSADCSVHQKELHCVIFPDNRNINQVSLYNGYALVEKDCKEIGNLTTYQRAQQHAKEVKVGVWAKE